MLHHSALLSLLLFFLYLTQSFFLTGKKISVSHSAGGIRSYPVRV